MQAMTTGASPCGFRLASNPMKKLKVWIDTDWGPGGINWDLLSKGMGKVYAEQGMDSWKSATIIIDTDPPKKNKKPKSKKA